MGFTFQKRDPRYVWLSFLVDFLLLNQTELVIHISLYIIEHMLKYGFPLPKTRPEIRLAPLPCRLVSS